MRAAVYGVRLFLWLPILVIVVLLGWALSWWVTVAAAAYFAVAVVPARLYRRRVRRRFANDPEGRRAFAEHAQRRLVRWAKVYGIGMALLLVALGILIVVLVAADRP